MARVKATTPVSSPWLVTFADVITLLMVFFVLLLSVSSIDKNSIADIGNANFFKKEPKKYPSANQFTSDLPRNKLDRLALFFPGKDTVGSEGSVFLAGTEVESSVEGTLILMKDYLLFYPETTTLSPEGARLLALLTPAILSGEFDVAIRTNQPNAQRFQGATEHKLLTVLAYFHSHGVAQKRLSMGTTEKLYDGQLIVNETAIVLKNKTN